MEPLASLKSPVQSPEVNKDNSSIIQNKQPSSSSRVEPKHFKSDYSTLDSLRTYDSSDSIDFKRDLSRKYLGRKGRRKGSLHLRRELVSFNEIALQRNLINNASEQNATLLKNLRDGLSQYFTPGNIRKSRNSHLNVDEDLNSIASDNKQSDSDSDRMGRKVSIFVLFLVFLVLFCFLTYVLFCLLNYSQ